MIHNSLKVYSLYLNTGTFNKYIFVKSIVGYFLYDTIGKYHYNMIDTMFENINENT